MFDRCFYIFRRFFLREKASVENKAPQILAVMHGGPSRTLLEAISKELGWVVTFCNQGLSVERLAMAPIVLYERDPLSVEWQPMLRSLTKRTPRPYVILLSPQVSLNLWDDLQRSGGSDLLRLPFSREMITDAVSRGWRVWTNQESLRAAGSQTLKQLPSSPA